MKKISGVFLVATIGCTALALPAHAASPRTQRAMAIVRDAARASTATAGVVTAALGVGLFSYGFAKLNHDAMSPREFAQGLGCLWGSYPVLSASISMIKSETGKMQFRRLRTWMRGSSR